MILIKDMEMPKSCMNCMFCGFAGADCELDLCQITGSAQKHIPFSKMPDCPLIEVPKSAKVKIEWEEDTDKLREKEFIHDGGAYAAVMSRDICNAPTIIPAEESNMDSFIRIFEEDDEEDGMDSFIRILKD